MAGEDDPTAQFSGSYWSMPNGREYAVFVEAASLPGWVHSWDRGGLTSALLMAVLVRSRHKGPPWAAIVVSGRNIVYRQEFTDLAKANSLAEDLDDGLRRVRYPPGVA
jgi:hypothetical protein